MLISLQKHGVKKGRWARPAAAVSSLRGTRSVIFQFNESVDSYLRYRIRSAKKRAKLSHLPFELTLIDLKKMLEKQDHSCALTGLDFYPPGNVSIDRIDSSKGYTLDNIQLVLKQVNLGKHTMSNSEFLIMCESVTEFNRTRSLIKPVNLGGGASQSQENPAGNSSSFDITPTTIFRKQV